MNRSTKISIIVGLFICSLLCFTFCMKKATTPVVTTNSIDEITQTTATSGGNITSDGNAEVSSRGVSYATSSNPTILNGFTSNSSGTGSFTSSIEGLISGTIYHVRAYATNSVGTSYGTDVPFTTAAATVITTAATTIPVVTTAGISGITQTTASGGGNLSADGGATATVKGVCWNTSTDPTIANSHTSDSTGTGTFTSSITGLISGTVYHVRAYATNSVATAYGADVPFTTTSSATILTVTTTGISGITQITASGGGNISSDGGATITNRGVCWNTTTNPTVTNSHTSDSTGTGIFTSSITGLISGTVYHVRAYATNSVATAYGPDVQFTTTSSATIPVVTTAVISGITQTTASGGGNVSSDGGATVTVRGVCWNTTTNPAVTNSHTSDGAGTGIFTSSITGLVASTNYHVRAYATNNAGTSYGPDVQFTSIGSGNTVLIIENQAYTNSITGVWNGVNIPRSKPTDFIYRNNSVTSVNSGGYMIQAGDEIPGSNNRNLDGEVITGNKFIWNGTDVASTITHGVFVGYNINSLIKYNYLYSVPTGMVIKSNGMTYIFGGVAYNIINKTGDIGIAIKGMNNVLIYNNTFYSNEVLFTSKSKPGTLSGLVDIFANDGLNPWVYPTGTKIKNNIFYTVNKIFNIKIENSQDLAGFESDYNVFWCESGTPMFSYLGVNKTFAQWQALGYDTHSVVVNPYFTDLTNFVPASRLDYGTNLGTEWQTGLSTTATWVLGNTPATTDQNGNWQVGARVY